MVVLSTIYFYVFPVAVVGLERAVYQVSEDVGVVKVCAIVYSPSTECPVEFSFEVTFFANSTSAGKYSLVTMRWSVSICISTSVW